MDTTGNPQSKHKRGGERREGFAARRRGPDPETLGGSSRPFGGSPSKRESERHSTGARKSRPANFR
jgi:hypothetical protein